MKEEVRELIAKNIDDNFTYIKNLFENSTDMVFRQFLCGNTKMALIYIDGMADKILLDDYVLESLMDSNGKKDYSEVDGSAKLIERLMSVTDLKKVDKLNEAIKAMLAGETLMLVDNAQYCIVIATRAWPNRGVGEPSGETVVRGSRDGFTETVRFNTVLVRRRIRDTRLKIEAKTLGTRSKTDCSILYISDIVNTDVLNETKKRLDGIEIDAILDSGYVEQLIEDDKWSLFPQVQATEKPDVVAAALYEGKVAILVDNSPFALIVPATLPAMFQSPDDYYQRWIYASCVRLIRVLSIFFSLILPGLYVSVTSFHTAIIPTKLAYSIAASREGVPFPAFVEAIIMEISLAILMEAIVRLPKAIGATIGIVGGLIIGQAAVSAGIVSPIMVIIVAVTTITSFITPNYEVTFAFRIVRFLIIIAASVLGLYGIALALIMLAIHLIKLKSFGISYLAPVVSMDRGDFKDLFVKYPLRYFKNRPKYMEPADKVRQK